MTFTEFFNEEAQEEAQEETQKRAYRQNMGKLGQTRDRFLEMLVKGGMESTHGLREVFFGGDAGKTRGRKTTTVKLVAVGEWAEKNYIRVEIFTTVAKNKLQQLQEWGKKPTVHVILTFDNKEARFAIPNNVTRSVAYEREEDRAGTIIGDESFCVGLMEVTEAFQAGKLIMVKE